MIIYAANWKNAFYVCINNGEAYVPEDIAEKAVGVNEDIAVVVDDLKAL